ncbi:MAG: 16S rRNA (guanine(527)-N(7))-methyltransferase RsmG [Sphingobacteriales bacterium 44-15]|nr:MAG: 16S rRNA (guanine(527)-N(7))-methyltransferase RsmG [Sphingobacteriales bacterium 44-15]
MEVVTKYFSEFSEKQLQQLLLLDDVYRHWNEKINVVSRKDIDQLYERHVLHSLAIAAVMNFTGNPDIIDIGTGGGFPGIPLAIMYPEIQFHLVDSIGKKLKVVNEVAAALQLKNVTTRHSRAEDITDRKFDFVVSRAVAPVKDLWRWGKPLLRDQRKMASFKNGLVCLKGGDLTAEIAESGLRPYTWKLDKMFEEEFFKEKYLLYCPL